MNIRIKQIIFEILLVQLLAAVELKELQDPCQPIVDSFQELADISGIGLKIEKLKANIYELSEKSQWNHKPGIFDGVKDLLIEAEQTSDIATKAALYDKALVKLYAVMLSNPTASVSLDESGLEHWLNQVVNTSISDLVIGPQLLEVFQSATNGGNLLEGTQGAGSPTGTAGSLFNAIGGSGHPTGEASSALLGAIEHSNGKPGNLLEATQQTGRPTGDASNFPGGAGHSFGGASNLPQGTGHPFRDGSYLPGGAGHSFGSASNPSGNEPSVYRVPNNPHRTNTCPECGFEFDRSEYDEFGFSDYECDDSYYDFYINVEITWPW